MPVKLGTTGIAGMYLGSKALVAAYVGVKPVFSTEPLVLAFDNVVGDRFGDFDGTTNTQIANVSGRIYHTIAPNGPNDFSKVELFINNSGVVVYEDGVYINRIVDVSQGDEVYYFVEFGWGGQTGTIYLNYSGAGGDPIDSFTYSFSGPS